MPSTFSFDLFQNLLKEDGDGLLKEDGDKLRLEQHAAVTIHDGVEEFEMLEEEEARRAREELVAAQTLDLALFANAHFGPDGTGDVPEPGEFDITVEPGEFEIRSPL